MTINESSTPREITGSVAISASRRSHRWLIWLFAAIGAAVLIIAIAATTVFFHLKSRADAAQAHKLALLDREYEFGEVADKCGISTLGYDVLDDGESIQFRRASTLETHKATGSQIKCFAGEIGAPSSFEFKLENTRALDGTLSEKWGNFQATWTYHPSQGLNIIFERTDSPPTLE